MRVPPQQQERRPFRVRGWMIAIAVIVLVLLFSLRGLAGFYTDYLWFDSLGQGSTWGSLLAAKVVPAFVFTVVFFVIMLGNLILADRIGPRIRGLGAQTPEDELVIRYQQATERYQGRIRIAVAVFFALIAGIGVSSQWKEWILFTNRVDFHVTDPQFHRDIGFYVFQLPFIKFMIDWLFAGLVIVLLVTAVSHYLNGGIRFQSPLQRVTPQVKMHLSVILAVMALVKTADYYFSRFELSTSERGTVDGLTFTDVHAQLPALNLLVFVSVIAAALFIWNIWRRGWVLPVIAVGLWAFVSLVVGTIYPAAIQNFKVKPNEFANESKYIARNIKATRAAYGLGKVNVQNFAASSLDATAAQSNASSIASVRLWDPNVIAGVYRNTQSLQTYYRINDVDVDRYTVDGRVTPVVVSARDLNSNELPQQTWVNEHLVFTHGYGGVASPNNQADCGTFDPNQKGCSRGKPLFFLSDIPTDENGITLNKRGAEIYFGEQLNDYVIVNAKQAELDFPRQGTSDAETRYDGKDGVKLSNFLRRAAFALRFGDPNPLISGQVDGKSKVLMLRNVKDRISKLAPFLELDNDPYPIVVNGRMLWVVDAYTVTDRYPYSQKTSGSGGLGEDFNYVRNSVKVTVDAYDGTVKFYVFDSKDPIIKAYAKAFPDLFTPGSKMPTAVREHLRYPEDMFTVQATTLAKYHVTEPRRFYQGSERWLLSPDPQSVAAVSGTGTTRRNSTRIEISATTKRQDPYYQYLRLPGDDHQSFLILEPFVPVSKGNQQNRLSAFMTAKSDPGDYGELDVFVTPQGRTIPGPVFAANGIQGDPQISPIFTLLSRGGSELVKGNVQLVPVGKSAVYVQPIFSQQSGGQGFPQFRFVAVFNDERAVLADTVADGVNALLGTPTTPSTPQTPTTNQSVTQLLNLASSEFDAADAALKQGDLGAYKDHVDKANGYLNQAIAKLKVDGGSTTPSTPTTTSPAQSASR